MAEPISFNAFLLENGLQKHEFSPAQLFSFADRAREKGDYETAEKAYRALSSNPDLELRTEARFRLGTMLSGLKRYRDAAIEFRKILDEKPQASRVRLELARVLAQIGDLRSARRELRQAQAGGLPPEVARLVDIYTSALRAHKPFGASLEIALAPDSNINRATQSQTLDTIIAPFDLSEDAQAQSGLGLTAKGQGYFRTGIDKRSNLLIRLSGRGDFYEKDQFNDYTMALQAGPEMRSGRDRISLAGGLAYRWYGNDPYSRIVSGTATISHPMGRKAQLRGTGSISHIDNKRNDLQDGEIYTTSIAYERALSEKLGGGVSISAVRQDLQDPGYATWSGSANFFAFREIGKTTLLASAGYSRLEADRRLFLFPRRRVDNRYTASLGATFRQFSFQGFAPLLRIRYERNDSTVGIYDFDRVAGEIGITRAF